MYTIEIPITPVPASRPKVGSRGVYYTKAHTQFVKEFNELLEYNQIKGIPEKLIEGNVRVVTCFYIPIPKSASKKKREELKNTYCTKYDIDNLEKLAWDTALTKIVIKDDKQIVWSESQKLWIDNDTGYIVMYVYELE